MLDDDFKKFAGEVDPEQLYQMIDILNEQQENMRFTVHEAIYLEELRLAWLLASLHVESHLTCSSDRPKLDGPASSFA